MTPAAFLFCTTLVTAVPHGSIAENTCRFIDPPFTGTRASAVEVPVQTGMNANAVLPITQAVPPITQNDQVASVAPIAPVVRVAARIEKPVVRVVRLHRPNNRGKVAHLTTFRRYGKFVVSPTASEISQKQEPDSFWEKLKRLDFLK